MAINPLPLAGVGLAAVAVAGGLYATGTGNADTPPSTLQTDENNPKPLVSLKGEDGYKDSSTDSNKFGYKFSSYFLSTTNLNNKDKWIERAASLKSAEGNLEENGFFKTIKQNATDATLKEKCKEAYNSIEINEENKWKEVWVYCSLGGTAPVTISNSTDATEKASVSGNLASKVGGLKKDELLSIKSTENDWIWKIKNEEKKIVDTDTFFKDKKNQDLKAVCEDAYKQDKGSGTPDTETQAVTYCSKPRVTVS